MLSLVKARSASVNRSPKQVMLRPARGAMHLA